MKEVILTIEENRKLAKDIFLLRLSGDLSEIKQSGEFVELTLEGFYLNRPFSVCDYTAHELVILYKILGQGTKKMAFNLQNKEIKGLIGLGNGFNMDKTSKPLLIGGGLGIAPLYNLAKKFNERHIRPTVILGFKNKSEVVYTDEFLQYADVIITTDDGSMGYNGNVISYLKNHQVDYDYYYACGPMPMLKYLSQYDNNGELSLEARMGCGFGACMGCSIQTTKGSKRVCKEGPVFPASEVIFSE